MENQLAYFEKGLGSKKEIYLSDNVQYPYNEVIRIVIEYGFAGFCLVALIFWLAFSLKPGTNDVFPYVNIARGGLIALLIFSLFSYPSEILSILLLGVFSLAVIANNTIPLKIIDINRIRLFPRITGFSIATLLILICLIWWRTTINKYGIVAWKEANVLYQNGDLDSSLIKYKEAYRWNRNNGLFLSNYGKALSLSKDYAQSIKVLNESALYLKDNITYLTLGDNFSALKDYPMAEVCYRKAINMTPSRVYPKYCIAILYYKANQLEKAQTVAREILSSNSKVQSLAESQIKEEMNKLLSYNN